MSKPKRDFDTIILGSGIAGTTLASILAKHGFNVLLLEKNTHPRWTIGEAMLPESGMWMWMVGETFGIPEIKNLSNIETVREHVSSSCGVKRLLGFLYHRKDERQNPNESHQLISPALSLISESHLFRQDVDLYMLNVAISYGVVYRDLTEVQQIDFQEDGVRVQTLEGEEYHARFLVDGSGYRSLLAEKLNLREKPTRLRTNSRGIFTHVTNLRPYDKCVPKEDLPGLSCTWHEGTLHHVFDGGWMWVIPFDNQTLSKSSLCSIGLMLNREKFPQKEGLSPEQEFQEIVEQFPTVAEHLKGIKPLHEWVSTDRIQYSSTKAVGYRYALLSHAYSFIDPLYSRGLVSNFETIYFLASRLIGALKDDDFSCERFSRMNRLLAARTDLYDRIIYNAYRSMSDFELWNAMTQFWLTYVILADTHLLGICLRYISSGDLSSFVNLEEEEPFPGGESTWSEGIEYVLNGYEAVLDWVDAGEIASEEAANQMLSLLKQSELLPQSIYPWGDSSARHIDLLADPTPLKPLILEKASFQVPEGLFG